MKQIFGNSNLQKDDEQKVIRKSESKIKLSKVIIFISVGLKNLVEPESFKIIFIQRLKVRCYRNQILVEQFRNRIFKKFFYSTIYDLESAHKVQR